MEKNIYIVSRCLGQHERETHFHFIGYFNGMRVKSISVSGGDFEVGEDYLLVLDGVYCIKEMMYGSLVKSKRVFT